MKLLAVAVGFLTRVPVGTNATPEEVGRAAAWFPVVGALLGGVWVAVLFATARFLPATVIAVLIVSAEAALTGALHLDGLADTADGLGGGRTREDMLRIMRDSAIGSYGATALVLVLGLQIAAIAALIPRAAAPLVLAPALGRWSIVPLARFLPYARPEPAVAAHIGNAETIWATLFAATLALAAAGWRGVVCWCAAAVSTAVFGWWCRRKIGGVTGDTLGAAVEVAQSVVLLTALALG